jgi:hypothetical protein
VAKKKQSPAAIQQELRDLTKGSGPAQQPSLKPALLRVGLMLLGVWVLGGIMSSVLHSSWPVYAALVVTGIVLGVGAWAYFTLQKQQKLGAILQGADTSEGRKAALEKLSAEYKESDAQAAFAKAQLLAQEDPQAALDTLDKIDLNKELAPFAAQVRATKAMLYLQTGNPKAARQEVDKLEFDKQQDVKVRAMFAGVAAEAWARTGQAKKAIDTLELFSTEDEAIADMRMQLLRARAFAYAADSDTKGVQRTLKKLAAIHPQLLGAFLNQKHVHPLLQQEAKQILIQSGAVQRSVSRQMM